MGSGSLKWTLATPAWTSSQRGRVSALCPSVWASASRSMTLLRMVVELATFRTPYAGEIFAAAVQAHTASMAFALDSGAAGFASYYGPLSRSP